MAAARASQVASAAESPRQRAASHWVVAFRRIRKNPHRQVTTRVVTAAARRLPRVVAAQTSAYIRQQLGPERGEVLYTMEWLVARVR